MNPRIAVCPRSNECLKANGLESLDACNEMLLAKGIDCDKIIRGIQPICFDNAVWAYTLGYRHRRQARPEERC